MYSLKKRRKTKSIEVLAVLWGVEGKACWLPVGHHVTSCSASVSLSFICAFHSSSELPASRVLVLVLSQNGQKNKRTKKLVSRSPSLTGLCVCFFNPQAKIDTAIHSQPCFLTLSVNLQRAAGPPEAKSDWNVFWKNEESRETVSPPNQDHQAVPVL